MWNLGLRLSRGEWIAFCDADDYWLPNKLQLQLNLASKKDCEIVFSNFYFLYPGTPHKKRFVYNKPEVTLSTLYRVNGIPMSTSMGKPMAVPGHLRPEQGKAPRTDQATEPDGHRSARAGHPQKGTGPEDPGPPQGHQYIEAESGIPGGAGAAQTAPSRCHPGKNSRYIWQLNQASFAKDQCQLVTLLLMVSDTYLQDQFRTLRPRQSEKMVVLMMQVVP